MKPSKKQTKAAFDCKCDFCRSTIKRGDPMVQSTVYDPDGRYTLRHHPECDRTADLTAIAQKEFA
jgi:hypothetical protein